MQIEPWLPPSILALFLWGISVFLPKLAVSRMGTMSLIVYLAVFYFLSAVGILLFYGRLPAFQTDGAFLSILIGIIGTLGQWCLVISLRNGMVTYAVLVSSFYPVVTLLLAQIFLHEELTMRQGIGAVLALASLVLLVMAQDEKK